SRREVRYSYSIQRQRYRSKGFRNRRRHRARDQNAGRRKDVTDVHRVVVTGSGVVSPIGLTAEAYCSALKQGVSGIGPITIPFADELNQKVVAEVKGFDAAKHFDDRQNSMLDRISQFAVVAAREAIAQAGLDFTGGLSERTATIIGVGVGGQNTH